MLVTSRTSSWVVPPLKVVFYKDKVVPTLGKAVLLEHRGFSRIVPAWRLRPGSAEDYARQAASVAAGRKADKELAVYHAVAGWAQGGRPSESA